MSDELSNDEIDELLKSAAGRSAEVPPKKLTDDEFESELLESVHAAVP